MQWHKMRSITLGIACGYAPHALSFVLLSGPTEATLNATVADPTINFAMSDEAPAIKNKAEFLAGKYKDLDDKAFFKALVEEAMATWNNVSTSYVTLAIDDSLTAVRDDSDHVNSIMVESVNASSAAFASPEIDKSIIVDCDIVVSSKSVEAKSLAYTLMHELGHCLGLGHNHTNYDAVMGYAREDRKLRLGVDDKLGVTYLYHNDDVGNPSETLGCASLGLAGDANLLKKSWLLMILALPLGLALRRRQPY